MKLKRSVSILLLLVVFSFSQVLGFAATLPQSSMKVVSGVNEHPDYPASNTLDGDKSTFWHTNWEKKPAVNPPYDLVYDLGNQYSVTKVLLTPRQGSSDGDNNGRPISLDVYSSLDGKTFTKQKSVNNINTGSVSDIVVAFDSVVSTKFLKVSITKAQNGAFGSLAEFNVEIEGSATVTTQATPAPATGTASEVKAGEKVKVEAETGKLAGSAQVEASDEKISGGKFVSYIDSEGSSVTFDNVPAAKSITIGYARGNSDEGVMGLYVNNKLVQNIKFPNTEDWYKIGTVDFNIDIPAGASVKLQFDSESQPINIDYIEFNGSQATIKATPKPTPKPVAKPTKKPVTKKATPKPPVKKATPKPTAKPKPVVVSASLKKSAKDLAVQVKKIAANGGKGLLDIVGKKGLTYSILDSAEGTIMDEIETKIKAKGLKTVGKGIYYEQGDFSINISQSLKTFTRINTKKLPEQVLKKSFSIYDDYNSKVRDFCGVIYQPNGEIILAGWQPYKEGYQDCWLMFSKEGSKYKLYKMISFG